MKFSELLKLIPKGLTNPEAILSGWINDAKMENGSLTHDQMAEIVRRRSICTSCPFNSINARSSQEYKELYGVNYESSFKTLHCAICTCPINKKTACIHCKCGLSEYNANNPDKPQQKLKW